MIDKVIMSTDDNPIYYEFWPLIATAWRKIMGDSVEVILCYISDRPDEESKHLEEYGTVIRFKKPKDFPFGHLSKVSRTLAAFRYPEHTCLMGDVDMLPLSAKYFLDGAKHCTDDNIVFYSGDCPYDGGGVSKFPICYILAKGKIYSEMLNPNNLSDDELVRSWFEDHFDPNERHDGFEPINGNKFSDESLYQVLHERWGIKDKNKHRIVKLDRGWISTRAKDRVDRAYWRIDQDVLMRGGYIDAHLPRPLNRHKQAIKPLTDYLGITHIIQD